MATWALVHSHALDGEDPYSVSIDFAGATAALAIISFDDSDNGWTYTGTYGAQGFSPEADISESSGNGSVILSLLAPAAGSNTLTIDGTGPGVGNSSTLMVIAIYSGSLSDAISELGYQNAAAPNYETASVVVANGSADEPVLAILALNAQGVTVTAGGDASLENNMVAANNAMRAVLFSATGAASRTMTANWTAGVSNGTLIAFKVNAGSSGGGNAARAASHYRRRRAA